MIRMNKQEFSLFTMALKTYYPRENLLPNTQAMELWYQQLQDIPYRTAEAALNQWVATNKWSPSIADIRETAAGVASGEVLDWGEGWEQVLKAIRKYGLYRAEDAMESFDPITRQCVERLGFKQICMSENISADRANFRMIYEQLAERRRQEAQMPEALKKPDRRYPEKADADRNQGGCVAWRSMKTCKTCAQRGQNSGVCRHRLPAGKYDPWHAGEHQNTVPQVPAVGRKRRCRKRRKR